MVGGGVGGSSFECEIDVCLCVPICVIVPCHSTTPDLHKGGVNPTLVSAHFA